MKRIAVLVAAGLGVLTALWQTTRRCSEQS